MLLVLQRHAPGRGLAAGGSLARKPGESLRPLPRPGAGRERHTAARGDDGSGAFLTQWSYDALDRVAAMTYPGGNGGQAGETVYITYNPQGLANSVYGASSYVQGAGYDALGRVDLLQLGTIPTVQQIEYVYYPWTTPNGQGRLQQIRTGAAGTPTDVQDLQYGYDAAGNVLSIVDSKVDGGPQSQSFGYDALDRLLSASAAGGSAGQGQYSEAYVYNNVGNMTSKGGVSYSYDDPDHRHAVTKLGGVQKYWYDANGNMTQRIVGSDTFEQSWDAENRLVEVRKNGSVVATYAYDGDGQRVQATVNGQTMAYVGNHVEWSGNTGTMVRYYYAGGQRVAMRKGSALYYLLGDHLGSTAVIVDSGGTRVAELRYKAYGETRYSYSTTPTNYRFTGQRWEYSVKLYQMGARWYDPFVSRFLSPDSIIPQPASPQSFNRYSYAYNNPLKHTDPNGHMPCGIACPGDWLSWEIGKGEGYHGSWDPGQQAMNRAKAELVVSLGDVALSIVNEPYDWASTAARCSQGECNVLDYAGFLPLIPGALGRLDDVGRVASKLGDAADAIEQGFRKLTKGNFRENLRRFTGMTKEGITGLGAHHVLPDEFADKFWKAGIENIHDPKFGAWVGRGPHRGWSYGYNRDWERFFQGFEQQGMMPTEQQILEFAQQLAERYGFDVNFAVP